MEAQERMARVNDALADLFEIQAEFQRDPGRRSETRPSG